MKKLSLLAATAIAALVSISIAHADNSGVFVQADAGRTTVSTSNGKFSFGVSGGYRWAVAPSFALGVEAGYVDLGHRSNTYNYSLNYGPHSLSGTSRNRGSVKAATLGVNAKWDMSETYFLMLRGGIARYRLNNTTKSYSVSDGVSYSDSDSDIHNSTRYYVGAGFGMHLMPNLDLQVTYDHYAPRYSTYGYHLSPKLNSWSAGVEYRF
ncbi:outer membrane beta-barrel protein [Luteibacter sp.]|uniref:outer membrane protein n=1 Tax=Luteibacter sp. TaxID=1886636 RepID=UPI0025C45EC3|nr:outer membrane beta-barrel protein [Luteibacter sp.]